MYSKLFETPTNKQLTTGTATSEALNTPTHEAFDTLAEVLPPPEIRVMVLDYLLFVDFLPWAQYIPFQALSFRAMWNARFRESVAWEEYDVVQSMLRQDPFLMVNQGPIIDCSGRIFENTSGFEYALWALSAPMWELMLDSVPDTLEGDKLISTLVSQYNRVCTGEVAYSLNGNRIEEEQFNFSKIIGAIQRLINVLNRPGSKDWPEVHRQCATNIGGAQNLLPMHVVDHYCSPESFESPPAFVSRSRSTRRFFNKDTKLHEDWFHVNSRRGIDFAVYKGSESGAVTLGHSGSLVNFGAVPAECERDVAAIKALMNGSKERRISLGGKLKALEVFNPLVRALPTSPQAQELVLDYIPPDDFCPWIRHISHLPLFFKPMWGNRFRQYVVMDNMEQVDFMLRKDPFLMVQPGKITGHTGVFFEETSGFQYALLIKNKPMCDLMIDCIPDTKEGRKLKITLLTELYIRG